jgi:hypothetical protein
MHELTTASSMHGSQQRADHCSAMTSRGRAPIRLQWAAKRPSRGSPPQIAPKYPPHLPPTVRPAILEHPSTKPGSTVTNNPNPNRNITGESLDGLINLLIVTVKRNSGCKQRHVSLWVECASLMKRCAPITTLLRSLFSSVETANATGSSSTIRTTFWNAQRTPPCGVKRNQRFY